MADISILQLPPTDFVQANDVTVVVQNGITKKVAASVFQNGVTGPTGPTGPQGPAGVAGPIGPQGVQGNLGPAGQQGPAGPAGQTGAPGATGPQGPVGATGAQGPQGNQGPQGATGPIGPQGPAGADGHDVMVNVGTTTTSAPGGNADVINVGTPQNAVLDFVIPRGDTGPTGPTGPTGAGVPTGGTTKQALVKIDGTNYNDQWANIANSVNGQTGDVVLGSMSNQNSTAVSITGGSIDGTPIGATTPAAITGTSITATTQLTLPPSTATNAPLHMPYGAAPTSPNQGDIWTSYTGIYFKNAYNNIEQLDIGSNAAGTLTAPTITVTGSGATIDVSSVNALIFSTSNWNGDYKEYVIPAATGLALTDQSANYLVVNYNSGSPVYQITTNVSTINNSNIVGAALLWRAGTQVHFQPIDWGLSTASRLNRRLVQTNRYQWASGLALGESTGNVITLTSGVIWYGVTQYNETAQTSASNNCDFYYHVGGVWTTNTVSSYNITQYDDGTNLQTLANGRYAVNWVYRYLDGSGLPKLAIVLGSGNYTQAQALASSSPTPPPILSTMALLVGRIVVVKNAATAFEIDSAFTQVFANTAVANHNDLAGLQGGTTNEEYHLTSAEYTGTGTGTFVRATSPTLVTPALGTPSALVLTNATGLPNAGLINSSVTVNGSAISLGGSATITAVNPNALTIGTGLTGTSYIGSAPVTIAIDSTVATLAGTQTLTNKTISGANNTLTNIGNASLTNSSVTVNGSTVSLGGTTTITANTTNALTIGTGLSGTSFNGGTPTTIALANSGVTSGTYGSASVVPVITVNAQGQITSVSTQPTNAPSYQGTWNASTNTPTLTSSVGTAGQYYVVSVAGNTTLNGVSGWNVGDRAIFENSVWQKIPGSASESFTNLTTTNLAVTGLTGYMYANGAGNVTAATGIPTTALTGTVTNAQLTNSAITINGSPTSLGGSVSVGTVTSVGLALPTSVFTVTGSPVTGSGTLTGTLANQSANLFFAGPSTGPASAPTFRAIVAGDVPTLNQNTTGTASNVTGTVAVANGGTGLTSFAANLIHYGAFNTSTQLQFNGTTFQVGSGSLLGGTTNPLSASVGASSNYIQSYIYNSTNGISSSADFVSYPNNGTDAHGWVDMGITSLAYADTTYTVTGPNEAYLFGSAPSSSGTSGNLVYATDNTGSTNYHQWYVGGFTQLKSAWKMQLTGTGLGVAGTGNFTSGISGGTF